jgi:hypothetical protein
MSDIKEQFQTWLETYPLDGELRKEEYDLMCDSYIAGFESQQSEITRLNAIIKENESDAKRYRWIKKQSSFIHVMFERYDLSTGYADLMSAKCGQSLDIAIDQAMSVKGE